MIGFTCVQYLSAPMRWCWTTSDAPPTKYSVLWSAGVHRHTGVEIQLTFCFCWIHRLYFPKNASCSLKRARETSSFMFIFVCFLLLAGWGETSLHSSCVEITKPFYSLTKRHTDVLTNDACVKRRAALMYILQTYQYVPRSGQHIACYC